MPEQSEDKLRNQQDNDRDSLAEQKKMENGVDIEPEADEWVAKPVAYVEEDSKSSTQD
ncbi:MULTISPECIES: hypothetical protein [Paenibacillus]|uniref:hypothetical protein n=1 Tax=Paenibacillus TaxID=44249 RepID=UPI000B14FB69|nr:MULTISPECIES: hypothetical protein [Paenibacillus]GIP23910.1 hypothetical protein J22TS3_41850 [Paenibacillus sp. J22TS3]